MVNSGMGLDEVSRYLGHSSTGPTRRYAIHTVETLGHHAAHLQDVRQIVRRPCGQKLPHGHRTQRRMCPLQFKLRGLQVQRAQAREIVGAQRAESSELREPEW